MPILATIEVDDEGSEKLANFGDNLAKLKGRIQDSNNALDTLVPTSKRTGNALDELSVSSREVEEQLKLVSAAAPQVVAAMQAEAQAYYQAYQSAIQANSAITALIAGMQEEAQWAKTVGDSILFFSSGLSALATSLKAGVAVTQEQKNALQELTEVAKAGGSFTEEQARQIEALNSKLQAGIPLTQAEAEAMKELAESYAVSNREVLGLGSAMDMLIAKEQQASAEAQKHGTTLKILADQLEAGVQATTLQKAALDELSQSIKVNESFTEADVKALQDLSSALQQNGTLTQEQVTKLKSLNEQLNKTAQETESAASATDKFKMATAALAATLILIAGGLAAYLKGASDVAARVQVLGTVQEVVAKNAFKSNAELSIAVTRIKALGITTKDATDAIIAFTTANLKASDASKIARAAQDLAVVAGKNSSETFTSLTNIIESNTAMALRQFGIITNNSKIYGEYARSINKAADDLTELEKKQAYVNVILKEGEKVAGAYENSMRDVGKAASSLARYEEEMALTIGNSLLPAQMILVKVQTDLYKTFLDMGPAAQGATAAFAIFITTATALAGALAGAKFFGIIDIFKSAGLAATGMSVAFTGATTVTGGLAAAFTALKLAMGPFLFWLTAVTLAIAALVSIYVAWSSARDRAAAQSEKETLAMVSQNRSIEEQIAWFREQASVVYTTATEWERYNKRK